MTEADFRFKHSQLIGYYQLIEMRLKGICAVLLADEKMDWFTRLKDYEADPWGLLVQKLKEYQVQKGITLLDAADLEELDEMRKTRNYWVHQCFGPHPIVFKKGEVRDTRYAQMIISDLDDAIRWDIKLTESFCSFSHRA